MNGRPESLIDTTARLDVLTVLGTEPVLITAYTLSTQLLPVNGTQRKTILLSLKKLLRALLRRYGGSAPRVTNGKLWCTTEIAALDARTVPEEH